MAVDRHIAVFVQEIQQRLELELIRHTAAFKALILRKAIAVLACRADAHGVEAVHAAGGGQIAVHLHAGDDQHVRIGREVFIIVDAVIGERQKIVAVACVQADDLLRRAAAVGTRGVAVQTALEQFFFAAKRSLSEHGKGSFPFQMLCTL